MSDYKNYIGKYIQQQRLGVGMPLREMANILGITPSKLNDIELGNTLPELELLQLMEAKLGIKTDSCIEFLLNWTGKKRNATAKKTKTPAVQTCYVRGYKDDHQM